MIRSMNTKMISTGIRHLALNGAGCFVLLLLSGAVSASIGVISLEELTSKAELIVYGRVAAIESQLSHRSTSAGTLQLAIATVHIEADKILKGSAADPLVVTAVENMEDSPHFLQDQEVFLFLTLNAGDSSYSVIGLTQGKFDVSDGRVDREGSSVNQFAQQLQELVSTQQGQ